MSKVYLAGPITGLSYEEAKNGWRYEISHYLSSNIQVFSPMRHKEGLEGIQKLQAEGIDLNPLTTNKGTVTRDRFDCMGADLIIANLLGAERISIGTMVEFGWADANRVPIVTIIEPGNVHWHGFILELSGYVVGSIREAASIANHILLQGV